MNISYGATFAPAPAFSRSIDFYRIDVDDRVVLTGNLITTQTVALLTANGFPASAARGTSPMPSTRAPTASMSWPTMACK